MYFKVPAYSDLRELDLENRAILWLKNNHNVMLLMLKEASQKDVSVKSTEHRFW